MQRFIGMLRRQHRREASVLQRRPAALRPVILITGFGPFPSVPVNATTFLVPELAEKISRRHRSHAIETAILPTEWTAGPDAMRELLVEHAPVLALHFGVSSRARGFEIEVVGRNHRQAAADACGETPLAGCIIDGAPGQLATNLPAARIVARLRRLDIPAFLSRDAGGYLCNAVLYHSLTAVGPAPETISNGFVHIPEALVKLPRRRRGGSRCPLDWEQTIEGAMEIVATCLGQPARTTR